MAEVVWTLEALDDLDAIGAFYERTSPSYVASLVERLHESVKVLEEHPRLGRKVPEIDHDLVRELIVERYRVVYQLMRERIETAGQAFLSAAIIFCSFALLQGCSSSAESEATASYRAAIEAWRQERADELRTDWLTLAGLYWLEEGKNTFGSDSTNDLVFPLEAPARIGALFLEDGTLCLQVRPGVGVKYDGEPVDTLSLRTDAEGAPAVLTLGSLRWYVIERVGRLAVRLHDREKGMGFTAEDLDYYSLDPAWRIEGTFVPHDSLRTIPVPNILGTVTTMTSPGAVVFEVEGETYRLDVFESGPEDYFVMFADQTNRDETYQAGRYLHISREDTAGNIVIDFNKAYNPPCTFTPYATCPFPPPQNRLALRVEAGEKRYHKVSEAKEEPGPVASTRW